MCNPVCILQVKGILIHNLAAHFKDNCLGECFLIIRKQKLSQF